MTETLATPTAPRRRQMYGAFENSMSVTAADGTQYTLTLPKDALLSSQT